MKQSIKNSKILRAVLGRFLTAAVVLATALTVSIPAKADPGHGAIVTFFRGQTGHTVLISPDGQLRIDIVTDNPGNHVRLNPDGTFTLDETATRAPISVSVLESNGDWAVKWSGSGSYHLTDIVEPAADGGYDFTDQALYVYVQGQLTKLADGSPWSLHVVAAIQNSEFKAFKFDLQPK